MTIEEDLDHPRKSCTNEELRSRGVREGVGKGIKKEGMHKTQRENFGYSVVQLFSHRPSSTLERKLFPTLLHVSTFPTFISSHSSDLFDLPFPSSILSMAFTQPLTHTSNPAQIHIVLLSPQHHHMSSKHRTRFLPTMPSIVFD